MEHWMQHNEYTQLLKDSFQMRNKTVDEHHAWCAGWQECKQALKLRVQTCRVGPAAEKGNPNVKWSIKCMVRPAVRNPGFRIPSK
eukprot:1158827-Pelagomonas_calceolata.AAC.4